MAQGHIVTPTYITATGLRQRNKRTGRRDGTGSKGWLVKQRQRMAECNMDDGIGKKKVEQEEGGREDGFLFAVRRLCADPSAH